MSKIIRFEEDTCTNLKAALEKEWLESNGVGGYASSTIVGVNSSRYHGLLVCPFAEGGERAVFLSKCEEEVIVGGDSTYLSCNLYPDTIHPTGFMHLKEFRIDPFPTYVYKTDDFEIEKKIFMIHGEHSVVIVYTLLSGATEVLLKVKPLLAVRSYHTLIRENSFIKKSYDVSNNTVELHPYQGIPPFYFVHDAYLISGTGVWYRNFTYPQEIERGEDAHEDLFNPLEFGFVLNPGRSVHLLATLHKTGERTFTWIEHNERVRRDQLQEEANQHNTEKGITCFSPLIRMADTFLVQRRGGENSIIAGFPWFGEWCRDTMISLTGLTLVTKRFDVAQSIFKRYSTELKHGMLPNTYSEQTGEPEYTSIDGALWFMHAAYKYLQYTGDFNFVETELYPAMRSIVRAFVSDEECTLHMEHDGLLTCGGDRAVTWMDAAMGTIVMTPRRGKIVEINALWFQAVKLLELLSKRFKLQEDHIEYKKIALKVKNNFSKVFWCPEKKYLYDFVDEEYKDTSLRPNQLFAVAIPFSLLEYKMEQTIVETVEKELLTLYGLRTLAAEDTKYIGKYKGDRYARDSAYHQGTVWPWLLGVFIDSYFKVNSGQQNYDKLCTTLLHPLLNHSNQEAGLGFISEIFDGDFPHRPCGCFAQAWSVAEVIRIYHEYVCSTHMPKMPLSVEQY